ncbi:hypothetical protein [Sphingomonas sp. PAMC 26605]|nr:hypothetical protein [Sphingomonas sp. PAMC 26605]
MIAPRVIPRDRRDVLGEGLGGALFEVDPGCIGTPTQRYRGYDQRRAM